MVKAQVRDDEQSDFNSAIATLQRIDEIKKGLIIATTNEDYPMLWKFLKAYFKELVSVMNSDDDKAQRERFFDVRRKYHEYERAIRTGKRSISYEVIDAIEDWEVELKNLEQKYGMNMPKKKDSRYSLTSR